LTKLGWIAKASRASTSALSGFPIARKQALRFPRIMAFSGAISRACYLEIEIYDISNKLIYNQVIEMLSHTCE
jgi:hypothetical protein